MSSTQRPILPPKVLEALRSGNKIEAIKLLREGGQLGIAEAKAMIDRLEGKGGAAKATLARAKAATVGAVKTHSVPHDPRRPGLSPGEVPHGGSGFGWLALMVVGLLVILAVL